MLCSLYTSGYTSTTPSHSGSGGRSGTCQRPIDHHQVGSQPPSTTLALTSHLLFSLLFSSLLPSPLPFSSPSLSTSILPRGVDHPPSPIASTSRRDRSVRRPIGLPLFRPSSVSFPRGQFNYIQGTRKKKKFTWTGITPNPPVSSLTSHRFLLPDQSLPVQFSVQPSWSPPPDHSRRFSLLRTSRSTRSVRAG